MATLVRDLNLTASVAAIDTSACGALKLAADEAVGALRAVDRVTLAMRDDAEPPLAAYVAIGTANASRAGTLLASPPSAAEVAAIVAAHVFEFVLEPGRRAMAAIATKAVDASSTELAAFRADVTAAPPGPDRTAAEAVLADLDALVPSVVSAPGADFPIAEPVLFHMP